MTILPVHRSILAVDIESSTSPLRTNPIKAELRDQLYRLLREAMDYTGICARHCDRIEDRGDGLLAFVHPVDDVPKTYLLSRFVPELARLLREYNLGLPATERARRGLRLRAVVHAGEIHHDENGFFGEAIDVACRLLDAPRLKRCLRESGEPLVLIISEDIYWAIVQHEYDGIRQETFQPEVRVTVSGRRRQGWVHVPAFPGGMSSDPSAA